MLAHRQSRKPQMKGGFDCRNPLKQGPDSAMFLNEAPENSPADTLFFWVRL